MLDNLKKYKKVKSIKLSKKYHCPDCDSELIEDHGYFFKCLKCLLEFDEDDLELLEEVSEFLQEQQQLQIDRDKDSEENSKQPKKLTDDKVTKSSLERTIGFISQLEFSEEDYENLFKKFKPILKNQTIKNKLDILEEIDEGDSPNDLETMTKIILDKIGIQDLKFILEKIIKDEDLTNFIQDLILKKLI